MKNKSEPRRTGLKPARLDPDPSPVIQLPPPPLPAFERLPSYEQVAARARVLWLEKGCPLNCDEEIWLEAEREFSNPPREAPKEDFEVFFDQDGLPATRAAAALSRVAKAAVDRSSTSL